MLHPAIACFVVPRASCLLHPPTHPPTALAPRPIFIVGMPRSGSTLLEQVLSTHSQVWGAGEDTLLAPSVPELLEALNLNSGGSINPEKASGWFGWDGWVGGWVG